MFKDAKFGGRVSNHPAMLANKTAKHAGTKPAPAPKPGTNGKAKGGKK